MDLLQYIEKFFTENYELVIYIDNPSVGTDFTPVVEDTVPSDREALVLELAVDRTLDGEADVQVEKKSIFKNPLHFSGFPADFKGLKILKKVEPRKTYTLLLRGVGASITAPYRFVVLLKRLRS